MQPACHGILEAQGCHITWFPSGFGSLAIVIAGKCPCLPNLCLKALIWRLCFFEDLLQSSIFWFRPRRVQLLVLPPVAKLLARDDVEASPSSFFKALVRGLGNCCLNCCVLLLPTLHSCFVLKGMTRFVAFIATFFSCNDVVHQLRIFHLMGDHVIAGCHAATMCQWLSLLTTKFHFSSVGILTGCDALFHAIVAELLLDGMEEVYVPMLVCSVE
mmetsp:Transcript_57886/g.102853  ORF Transcript_57886/g.102853 Transcript_57886/m.102853 type:complete len:215 (-) Transcript_57886:92-736(-)